MFDNLTSFAPSDAADRAASALAAPVPASEPEQARLLALAHEAGVGATALGVLERIEPGQLCAHDRVRYLRLLESHQGWLHALTTLSVAAVAGTYDGWVRTAVEKEVSAVLAEMPPVAPQRARPPGADAEATQESSPDLASRVQEWALHSSAEEDAWRTRERAAHTEVGLALRVSVRTAGRRVETSRFLASVPAVLQPALDGHWGYGHVRAVEAELTGLDRPLIDLVVRDIIPAGVADTPQRLMQRIRRSLAKHDAEAMSERFREKADEVEVSCYPLPDGQARLSLTGPQGMVTWAHRTLTEIAKARQQWLASAAGPDVPREEQPRRDLDSLRADALVEAMRRLHRDMTCGDGEMAGSGPANGKDAAGLEADPGNDALTTAPPPVDGKRVDPWTGPPAHGPGSRTRPEATVLIDIATALGMAQNPGWLPGYGWIPAPIARELLGGTRKWRRWLLDDETRQVIDAGSAHYRPTAALRRLVSARHLTCTNPLCQRPATQCQLDHADDFDGRNTTVGNLHPACGPDHLLITSGYFIPTVIDIPSQPTDREGNVAQERPAGEAPAVEWTSAITGHTYPTPPHPIHAADPDREDVRQAISAIEAVTHEMLTAA